MRQDILVSQPDGTKVIDISKAVSKGYGNFWFTNNHCRYRFLKGSRNSGKSYTVAYEIIMKIMSDARVNILVCRQDYSDIRNSIYEGIIRAIYDLGVERFFKMTTQPLEITYLTPGGEGRNQKILFRGLHDPQSIASLTVSNGYITSCYVEEAFEITNYADIIKLDGSLRGKLPAGLFHQMTFMFNAWSNDHWLYTEFFKGRLEDDFDILEKRYYMDYMDENFIGPYGKGIYLHISTFRLNTFRDTDVYDVAMENMAKVDPERYKVEALGMWGVGGSSCYPAFNDNCLESVQTLLSKRYVGCAIGLDTGYSTAEGKRHKVLDGQDASAIVGAANVLTLVGITEGYREIVVLDEYFHTNDSTYFEFNTDKEFHPGAMTMPELCSYMAVVIRDWIRKYESYVGKPRGSVLMTGNVDVFVDSADIASRQLLDLELRKLGVYNVRLFGGSKLSIQNRVDFENALQHYGNWKVCKENCPNTIREFKNARRGDKGEARADLNDHCLTSLEYAYTPYWIELIRYHNFKSH